jgi:hypothetical protein
MTNSDNKCFMSLKRILFTILVFGSFFMHQVLIGQNKANVTASSSGNINCINSSTTLSCSPIGDNFIIKWEGPNGYISTDRNPVTSIPGVYTANITDPLTDKTSLVSVTVLLDTITPKDVLATTSGLLTCKDTLITLNGSSNTGGANFEWQGPEGFAFKGESPTTTVPGIYILKVTNPANGCFKKKNVVVYQNITPPDNVTAYASGILNCITTSTKLTGISDTPGISYNWKGPDNFSSSQPNTLVSIPGIFELTVTKSDNGCLAKTKVEVKQDIKKPEGVQVNIPDTLTCKTHLVQLTSLSENKGVNYNWTGPDNFNSDKQTVQTNIPGKYTILVTNPGNGCVTKKHIDVIKNVKPPEDLALKVSGKLTCKDSTLIISTSSTTSGLNYVWSGPKNFTSKAASPIVTTPGEYTVKATNLFNGCSVTESIYVKENITKPSGIIATVSGEIDCNNSPVKLKGNCDNEKMNYKWKGPNDFESSKQNAETTIKGDYELIVMNPENGCISKTNITVLNNCLE